MYFFPFEDRGNLHQVSVGRVGAASDGYLIHLDFADVGNRVYIVRAVRLRCQRRQLVQIHDQLLVVNRVRIGCQRSVIFFSALGF